MMVIYNPIINAWNKLNLNVENHEIFDDCTNEKLIIIDHCLFFVQVCYSMSNKFILIFEMKIENRLLISII